MSLEPKQLVMCPSKELEWAAARILTVEGNKLVVIGLDSNKQETFQADQVIPVSDKSIESTDDMCKLPELHDSLILHNIRQRYLQDIIYTYIGPMIVSVNPYKTISSYGNHLIPEYRYKERDDLKPHLFSIAQKAYQSLVHEGHSQAVVISGESGAGKTESTKIVLTYLTAQMSNPKNDVDLAKMIIATNPVLEAFGNAKTIRNNNSSRFGKFIKIAFEGPKIVSARIDNYLLETTRVIHQAPNERNYHIFYQFVKGLRPEEKAKYLVKESANDYAYLVNGDLSVEGIDDRDWFDKTRSSLKILGFTESEVEQIFSLLSAILTLGNISFEGEDEVRIKDEEAFKDFCTLLGVYEGLARQSLTVRIFTAAKRGTGYKVPLTYSEAIENRDALAKLLYHRLFDWLVKKLNKSLKDRPEQTDIKFIGILDIYGFEIFTKNSLEQFCINYANEKLHQQFNHHMFKAEQEEYGKEGVPWKEIKFKDNQGCIDLIEKPFSGIISLLEEEARVPQGSDEGFLLRLDKKFRMNIWYEHHPKDPDQFMVKHFAGTVTYKITKFLEKNKDTIFPDLLKTCKSSSHEILKEFFEGESEVDKQEEPEESKTDEKVGITRAATMKSVPFGRNRGRTVVDEQKPDKRTKASVMSKFKEELTKLVDTLASAERHYVRCIKPNEIKASLNFDSPKVFSQLACNGVFETVTLRKAGFSYRMPFNAFIDRFFICLGFRSRDKAGIVDFMDEFFKDKKHDYAVGNTKVFLRDSALTQLCEYQAVLYKSGATTCQCYIRTYNAKMKLNYLIKLSNAALAAQKVLRRSFAIKVYMDLKKAWEEKIRKITTIQAYIRKQYAGFILCDLHNFSNAIIYIQKYFRRYHGISRYEILSDIRTKTLEEQRRLKEEYERRMKEEEQRREEEEKRREEERRKREEEDRKRREEEERLWQEERRRREEEEKKRREEEQRKWEEERKKREEEDRKWEEERRKRDEKKQKEKEKKKEEKGKRKKEKVRDSEEEEEEVVEDSPRESERERKRDGKIKRDDAVKDLNASAPAAAVGTTTVGGLFRKNSSRAKLPPINLKEANLSDDPSRSLGDLTELDTTPRRHNRSLGPRDQERILASLSPRGTVNFPRGMFGQSSPQSSQPVGRRESNGLVRRTSQLLMRTPVTPQPPVVQGGLVFELTEEDKTKLKEFFDTVGIPPLADLFAQQAIDLETMLAWDDPEKQLQDLGIGQQGVIFRVMKAIDAYNVQKNGLPPRNIPLRTRTSSRSNLNSPNNAKVPYSPRGSISQLPPPTPNAPPSLSFTINFITAHLIPYHKHQGSTGGLELYVKCDARSYNKRICNYRTQACTDSEHPNWGGDVAYTPTIPPGLSLCFEVWDSSSFMGDRKLAECIWDWTKIQTLHNGQHWLPLKSGADCAGELLISVSEYPEQELEYQWNPDILGADFESLPLRLQPGAFGPLTATLVRLKSSETSTTGVLYIHSFSDYFFNTEMAQAFVDEGFSFFALDLRRYGRSMVPNIPPNWTTTLYEYFEELHIAIDYMKRIEGMEKVILLGHGLGGLIAILFTEIHHAEVNAIMLNSPLVSLNRHWTDFISKKRGWFGSKGDPLSKHPTFSSLYHQSLHIHHYGEWTWDERLKPMPGFPIFLGWCDMLLEIIKRIENGMNIPIPVLMMVAVHSNTVVSWSEEMRNSDAIINVNKAISLAPKISGFVKLVVVKDGVHDLFLSSQKARQEVYTQMFGWMETLFGEADD